MKSSKSCWSDELTANFLFNLLFGICVLDKSESDACQKFAFSPRWNSKAGLIHSNICFLALAQSRSGLNTFTDRHIQIHIKQITRSEILRQYRKITLRVIFISYQSNCQQKKVNTDNLSASTSTTAQIFDANQIQIYPIHRYRIVSKKEN